jgi:hypothetical protein
MAIYLGNVGFVELRRTGSATPLSSVLDPSDVNASEKRFSFDFDANSLITGDKLQISTADGSNLDLVTGHAYPDGSWFCHVDSVGGIRLYSNFNDAINGEEGEALSLSTPASSQNITVKVVNTNYRYMAQMSAYEITTSRETVDLTSLGEEHRQNYDNGLISGQGRLTCFWDFESRFADLPTLANESNTPEVAQYLCSLLLRIQQGSGFEGRFYLKNDEQAAVNSDAMRRDSLWLEANCVVTNVAMSFEATTALTAQIDFITTGSIDLRIGKTYDLLLKEDDGRLLQESGSNIELERQAA